MSRPASFTSNEEDPFHRPRAYSTPNPPASYLYQGYNPIPFTIEAARAWARAWDTTRIERPRRRAPSPDDHSPFGRFRAYSVRGRQEFRRSSARRSTNPAYYNERADRAARMSEGDDLSRELGNIDIGLATIEEETTAETADENTVDDTAEGSGIDETGLLSTLSQLTLDTTAIEARSSTQNTNEQLTETAAETSASENDLSILCLAQLNFGAAAADAISSTIEGKGPSTTTARLSFLDDLDSLSDRGKEFVAHIHPEFHNPGVIRSTPEKPEPILVTYTNEIGKDITVPLDSIPNILRSEDEVELLKSLHHPLNVQLDSGFAEMQEAMQQPAWLETEGGNPVPMTPLTHPFRPTKASKFEKANGDVQIMHLENFSPAEDHIPLDILKNTSRKAPPAFLTENGQPQVDVQAIIEEVQTELALDDVMNSIHNEDDDVMEEESDSSVEIILDNWNPGKGVSTSIGYHRKPREKKPWTDGHEARMLHRKSSSGSGVAGANYRLLNISNFTLGDTTANQKLDHSTNSLPATPSTRESTSAGENRKGKSAAVKIATPLTRKAKHSTPKSKSGKEPQSHKRSPSDAFSDLDPFNKGKKVAKTQSKKTPSLKSPQPQASLPMHFASGLPEDEVDYGSTTREESDFSIDVNLEDSGARDGTLSSSGHFSAKSLSPSGPSFTVAAPRSGSKENDNLKRKATKITDRLLSSSIGLSSSQNKAISYASVAAAPLPVRRPQEPKTEPMLEPNPKRDDFPPLDPVIHKASANNKDPTQFSMRGDLLIEKIEQKAAKSYAAMLNSTPPSAAAAMASSRPIYSAPARNLSELKKGIRRYDEPALTKKNLSSMKPVKAKPAIAKAAMQPTQATASPDTTNTAAAAGPSSRLPIPARTSSIAPGAYAHTAAFNVNDTWSQTTWSGEHGGATTTVGGSGFQPIKKKKGNKRKTGKAATEWVVKPDDGFSDLPRGQARVPPPGATYVDERANERFAGGCSRRNKAGGRGGGSVGEGAGERVMKDYGEDGKGSIYDA